MLLHQPTLMHSFEGEILQLLPNSRELSMSSAKTIADILAFAELIDPRSFIGNPFTSQPIYIAACAFLKEAASQSLSQPTSRDASLPPQSSKGTSQPKGKLTKKNESLNESPSRKPKHSLLATAANQNYQRCYKALEQLETYWAGIRYILVALDQKQSGIDPQEVETYTMEEYNEAMRAKRLAIPTWKPRLNLSAPTPGQVSHLVRSPKAEAAPSPTIGPSQAIGWSLTGITNSPSSNLTFMYQNVDQSQSSAPVGVSNMLYDPIRASLPESTCGSTTTSGLHTRHQPYTRMRPPPQPMPPPASNYHTSSSDVVFASDAEMLLDLQQSPYSNLQPFSPTQRNPESIAPNGNYDFSQSANGPSPNKLLSGGNSFMGLGPGLGDMMMESQEIDMSAFGGDMIPWLEYLPQDMLSYFDGGGSGSAGGGGLNDNEVGK